MFQAQGVVKIKRHFLHTKTFFQKSCSSVQCMTFVCREVKVFKHSGSCSHIPGWFSHCVIVGRHQNSKEPNSYQQRHPILPLLRWATVLEFGDGHQAGKSWKFMYFKLTTVLLKYVGFKRKQKRFNKWAKILGHWKALERPLRKCSIYW